MRRIAELTLPTQVGPQTTRCGIRHMLEPPLWNRLESSGIGPSRPAPLRAMLALFSSAITLNLNSGHQEIQPCLYLTS